MMQCENDETHIQALNALGALAKTESDNDILPPLIQTVKNLVYENAKALERAKDLGFGDVE